MSDQLSLFGPEICEGSGSAISSPGLAGGRMPCASPDGLTIGPSGPALAPVSLSVQQARAEGRRTRVTFGRSSGASFASAGLQSSLENKLRQKLAGCGSPVFSLTLKHWFIAQQAPIFAVRASGRRISDSASISSWQAPIVNDALGSQYAYGPKRPNGSRAIFLKLPGEAQLATWATPTTRDHKDGSSDGAVPINALLGRQAWLASGLIATGSLAETAKPGQLNPAHSRWLMGYPPEWDDCAVTAMPSFRKLRRPS
jgi:hypothetical protein